MLWKAALDTVAGMFRMQPVIGIAASVASACLKGFVARETRRLHQGAPQKEVWIFDLHVSLDFGSIRDLGHV